MSNTYSSLYFHCIWATKSRHPFLVPPFNREMYDFVKSVGEKEGAQVVEVGGMPDHVHLLLSVKQSVHIPELIRKIKSESSWLMRKLNKEEKGCFMWQRGYAIFSVSVSNIDVVQRYIQNQEKHHKLRSFLEEFEVLLQRHGVNYDKKYLQEM